MQQQLTPVAAGWLSTRRWLTWLVGWLPVLWMAAAAAGEKVQVTDPFLELRTGPGRGYPVFYVVERDEWIEIELRHTDWFQVRASNGKEGWVPQAQLERTMTQIGTPTRFRDVFVDEYQRRRLEFGVAYGHFKSDSFEKLWLSYNPTENLAIEATGGQVQGSFSGTDLWHVNLLVEPWSDWRLGPFFGVGVGRLSNLPHASLVAANSSSANIADAMVGLRLHLADRFIARLDYTQYLAYIGDNRTDWYRAVTFGLGFFF